jgi:hypothetical protein
MKTRIIFLRIAGAISIFFMLFHLAFFKLFDWGNTLSCLSLENLSILWTYHYISILMTGFMGMVPFIHAKLLLKSSLKYSLLSFFSLFYLIRIVTEFTLFGFSWPQSPIIIAMCAIPMFFFALPLFYKLEQ